MSFGRQACRLPDSLQQKQPSIQYDGVDIDYLRYFCIDRWYYTIDSYIYNIIPNNIASIDIFLSNQFTLFSLSWHSSFRV